MAWLSGILSGYADRQGEIRKENAARDEEAAKQEAAIYSSLLDHPDPKIQAMAATGIFQMGQGRQRATGFDGWMGKMQNSPVYATLQKYMTTPQPVGDDSAPSPSRAQTALPTTPGTLAQPTTSPTQGAPMAAPQAAPQAAPASTAPPTPPASIALEPPPAALAAPVTPPPAPPPAFAPGAPAQPAAPRMAVPHFPTGEDRAISAARAKSLGDIRGETAGYAEMFRATGDPNPEKSAADLVMQEHMRRGGGTTRSISGQTIGPDGAPQQVFRVFDPVSRQYMDSAGRPDPNFRPVSFIGMGQYFEQAAVAAGYGRGSLVPETDFPRVQAMANELQQKANYAGVTGGAEARAAGPLTPTQAQTARVPAGTRGSQLSGQIIPVAAQADRRIALNSMADWIDRIDQALDVLPKKDTLGGYAPGVAIATMRALPQYREAFATLDSDINQILAALSRSVQGNVGTQTELDAKRAMDTLGQLQGSLLNPLQGDTQESARARLVETKAYLQQQLANLPATPVPTALPNAGAAPPAPPAAAAPAAGAAATPVAADPSETPPTGAKLWISPTGKVWVNGKPANR